jgi:hypothetical protein
MNDMSSVIVPKSDQINADSLIAGPITVTIKDVKIAPGTEQPVSMVLQETDLFFRPCKSMSRVLVAAWGPDAKAYIGRRLTLYRDPEVMWAGIKVGGIRISHMSHISEKKTMALTATRAQRKPFTVQPLSDTAERQPNYGIALAELKAIAQPGNMDALGAKWQEIGPEARKALAAELPALKAACQAPAPTTDDVPFDAQASTDPTDEPDTNTNDASKSDAAKAVDEVIAKAEAETNLAVLEQLIKDTEAHKVLLPEDQQLRLEIAFDKARNRLAPAEVD